MKRVLLISLIALTTVAAKAQNTTEQEGAPAKLVASNGKGARVFLQNMDEGKLTFQPYKSTKNITVPADKIKSLEFFVKYDEAATKTAFGNADYDTALGILEPVMNELNQYMIIENNLRDAFVMMYDAYVSKGDFAKVVELGIILAETGDENLEVKAKVGRALALIDSGDFAGAKTVGAELSVPAAALYVDACILRAQSKPKEAILTVNTIIADHANDMEWLPRSELLNAYLYLDMTGTNSVITTNSAINTARQVKNMYGGSNVAADAKKFWASLGGEAIEEAQIAQRKEAEAKRLEREAKKEAAAAEKRKAKAAARRKAAKAKKAAANTDVEEETVTNESE